MPHHPAIIIPEWAKNIRKGDVLESPSGALRVVRSVHPNVKPARTAFNFAIMHCSWTHAGYTCYNTSEIVRMGWKPTGVRHPLNTKFDKQLESDFGKCGSERTLTCCDVVGLP